MRIERSDIRPTRNLDGIFVFKETSPVFLSNTIGLKSREPKLLKNLAVILLMAFIVFSSDLGMGLLIYPRIAVASPPTSTPETDTVEFDNTVNKILPTADAIYVGGSFQMYGKSTGPGVWVNAATGALPSSWPRVTSSYGYAQIESAASDGSGGWYIGGDFDLVGGVTRQAAAHILSDGTVDPTWNPNVEAFTRVLTIAVSGSTVYLGGDFTTVDGQSRNCIAAVNNTDGTPTAWDAGIGSCEVDDIVVDGTTVYFGGDFSTVQATTRHRVAAVDTSGTLLAFNPDVNDLVLDLDLDSANNTMYVAGYITRVNGVVTVRNHVAAFDTSTSLVTAWDPNVNDIVDVVKASASEVYLGGYFATVNGGTARTKLAAVNKTDGTLLPLSITLNDQVFSFELSGSTLYVGGCFRTFDGTNQPTRRSVLAIDTTTDTMTSFTANANNCVNAIAADGTNVYIGAYNGTTFIGATLQGGLVKLDPSTGQPTSFNAKLGVYNTPDVFDMTMVGNILYIAGAFTSVNGTARNRGAAINVDTMALQPWNPNINNRVERMIIDGSTVYVGGWFTTVNGGTTRNKLAAVDATNGTLTAWNPNLNSGGFNPVRDMALDSANSTLYIGGSFTTVNGGTTRNRLAAIDTGTGTATSWNPNANNEVRALLLDGTTLYVGGAFTTFNAGVDTRNRVASFDTSTGSLSSWNPNASNNNVDYFMLDGTNILVGGSFTTINSTGRIGVAEVDKTTAAIGSWNPSLNSTAGDEDFAFAQYNGAYYIGGYINSIGGNPRLMFAQFGTPASPNSNPNAPTSLGPASLVDGSWGNDTTPTFNFNLSDPDGADTVKYQIQIDDTAGFGSPVIDYTSVLQAQGSASFTVGQAAGGGSYAVGSAGQTLTDSAGYYWQVKAIDNSAASSSFAAANSGAIAFKLDTLPPTPGSLSLLSHSTNSNTIGISGASDTDSGLAVLPYNFSNTTNSTSSGAQSADSWIDTGLSSSTAYQYEATVIDLAGNTATTSSFSATTASSGGGLPPGSQNPPTPPPGGFSIIINSGQADTANRLVNLALSGGSTVSTMAISNLADFYGAPQEPYATSKNWDLCLSLTACESGNKTVYVKFYTSFGQTSPVVSDSINLSLTSPQSPPPPPNNNTAPGQTKPPKINPPSNTPPTNNSNNPKQNQLPTPLPSVNESPAIAINSPEPTPASATLCQNILSRSQIQSQYRLALKEALTIYKISVRSARDLRKKQLSALPKGQQKQLREEIEQTYRSSVTTAKAIFENSKVQVKQTRAELLLQTNGPCATPPIITPTNTEPPTLPSNNNETTSPSSNENPENPPAVNNVPTVSGGGSGGVMGIVSAAISSLESVLYGWLAGIEVAYYDLTPPGTQLGLAYPAITSSQIAEKLPGGKATLSAVGTISALAIAPLSTATQAAGTGSLAVTSLALSDVWLIIVRWFQGLLVFIGLRKKRQPWGTVYDSVTKQPLDPAVVELIDAQNGLKLKESITDMYGRYGFLVKPGNYKISVTKSHFSFPSTIVKNTFDSIYQNLYHGENLSIPSESDVVTRNIPMDPQGRDWNQEAKLSRINVHPRLQQIINIGFSLVFWICGVVTLISVLASPNKWNVLLLMLYVLVVIWRYISLHQRLWGRVISGSAQSTEGIELQLKPLDIPDMILGKALVNREGKFFLKAPQGNYILAYAKAGLELGHSRISVGEEGIINRDIYI